MADSDESLSDKISSFAVGVATMASAITGNYAGCQTDDLQCQVDNLHEAHEMSKKDDDDDVEEEESDDD